MPRWNISFTQLAHNVVQQSPEPLTVDEIIAKVNAITPITTKNPKQTIRNAVSASYLIVSTGDRRYGWKPRLINGSVLRHTIQEAELSENVLYWDGDLRDALWPTFFAPQKYNDRSPVSVGLPDGTLEQVTLEYLGYKSWGTHVSPAFWNWFQTLEAKPGDHLIFRVIDGESKQYAVTFERRADRDEAAIAARNQAIIAAGLKRIRQPYFPPVWEIMTHLLVTGMYQHPIPPDPIREIWVEDLWNPDEDSAHPQEIQELASMVSDLFGQDTQVYDYENPPDLAREYDPNKGMRRPRLSRLARHKSVSSYVLRVQHRALPDVWRDIELAQDNTLEDLHLIIQQAFLWNDDHLYSFFLSNQSWDRSSEIGSPWSDSALHTHHVQIGQLELNEGQTFLYLFDYGETHEFDVTVKRINPLSPKGEYPRILKYHGKSPPQYPDFNEKSGEPSWDPHRHWKP
jgi:hypothetical protein